MKKSSKGFAQLVLLLALALSAVGAGVYEIHKAREKNTAAPIVQTVAAVQTVTDTHVADNAARDRRDAAQIATEQEAAGFLAGAMLYFDANPSPVPQRFVRDAAALLPPATTQQEKEFAAILVSLKAQNDLALQSKETQIAGLNGELKLAKAAESQTRKDSDAAVTVAQKDAQDIKVVHITFVARVKAWLWGLGFLGIGGAILVPLVAMAFPALAPVCRAITAPFLALWHALAAKTEAELAVVKTKLESEVAAHAATRESLVKIATAP